MRKKAYDSKRNPIFKLSELKYLSLKEKKSNEILRIARVKLEKSESKMVNRLFEYMGNLPQRLNIMYKR